MIGRTWNRATNNASPGEVSCSASLSAMNPMVGDQPRCFHRTGSATDQYSRILGVMNTNGRVSYAATLAGKTGRPSNGHWFEFNADGQQNLFIGDAEVVFMFESGEQIPFKLSQCEAPGGVHIFS